MVYTAAVINGDSAVAYMASESMSAGVGDAAVSTVGLINPVPGTSALRAAGKAEAAASVAKAVNGNSKLSEKAQHLYEISDSTGKVVKTGVSGGAEVGGESVRALKQASKWEKEGKGKFTTEIVDRVDAGPGARQKVLGLEKANAQRLRGEGQLDPDFHTRP